MAPAKAEAESSRIPMPSPITEIHLKVVNLIPPQQATTVGLEQAFLDTFPAPRDPKSADFFSFFP